MRKRILCVWLPAWPLERLAATRAELNGRATLLYEPSRGALRVVAYAPARFASGAAGPAASAGIRPGMPLAEAVALHEYAVSRQKSSTGKNRHPLPLHIEAHDPLADRLALQQLAQRMSEFSPLVSLEDAPRPASLLLDITGLAALFGGEERLAERVAETLAERRLTARLAIADTRGAAWGVAHWGVAQDDLREVARAAPLVIAPGESRLALAPLPLAALRLSAATIETLSELGIRRIGSLLHLPRGAVASRFGPETLRRLDEALGDAADVAPAQKPDEPLAAERLFEFPTDRRERVEATLAELLDELLAPLVRERKGFLRLVCRLGRVGQSAVEFEVGLFRPTAAPRHVLELMRLRLDSLALRLARQAPVESVRIAVTAAAPMRLEQQDLFGEASSRESPRRLAALIDRLASRLGRQAVARPALLADVQPEYACQYPPLDAEPAALGGRSPRKPRQRRETAPAHYRRPALLPGERPLRLLASPEPLTVASIADGPPARFEFDGRSEKIVASWGPERIETGWWRGRCLRRDYYRVETAAGSRFWLFRRLADGRWFLHGEFE